MQLKSVKALKPFIYNDNYKFSKHQKNWSQRHLMLPFSTCGGARSYLDMERT